MSLAANRRDSPPHPAGQAPSERRPTLSLLYHELHTGQSAYGYSLSIATFREHLALFSTLRSNSDAQLSPEITFDDGHISNFEQALPSLLDSGWKARFFITAGWTSVRREYMSWEQLRELARFGQQIGAHGWSHKLLTHCSEDELDIELGTARKVLEDKLSTSITTLSLPGGRFNPRVLAACRRAGYTQVFTSVPQSQTSTQAELVGRVNLRSDVTTEWLAKLYASGSDTRRKLEVTYRIKEAAQRTLGDRLYMKLWALLNKPEAGDHPA